jgi:hypothetical protein
VIFQVCVQVGDIPTSKHSLKKAHKLGAPTSEESERIVKYFKAGNRRLTTHFNLKFCFSEVFVIIPPANKVWGVYRNHPVRPSMYLVSATPPKSLIRFL